MTTVLRVGMPTVHATDFQGELAPYRVDQTPDAHLSCFHIDVPGSDADLFPEASMNALAFISRNQAVLQKAKDCGASLILDFGIMIDGSFASRSLLIQPALSKVAGELGMEINLAIYVAREDTA